MRSPSRGTFALTTFSSSSASLARRYVYVFADSSTLRRIEGIGVSPF